MRLLRKEVENLRLIIRLIAAGACILIALLFAISNKDTLRVKEIIVEDKNGNPFIIMGNPISRYQKRKRKDSLQGIVFLDSTGTDRLFIGKDSKLQMGGELVNRGSQGWSYLINDTVGDERGGFGFSDDENRIGLGLDYGGKDGLEGIYLNVSEDLAYMVINGNVKKGVHDRIVLWHDGEKDLSMIKIGDKTKDDRIILKTQAGRSGIYYRDTIQNKINISK